MTVNKPQPHIEAETIEFYGKPLLTFLHDGIQYVPVKPVIRGMGLGWSADRFKVQNQGRFPIVTWRIKTGTRSAPMLCLAIDHLAVWLGDIKPEKITSKPEAIRRIEQYKLYCLHALAPEIRWSPTRKPMPNLSGHRVPGHRCFEIEFYGQAIYAAKAFDTIWVSLQTLCDGMCLHLEAQQAKFNADYEHRNLRHKSLILLTTKGQRKRMYCVELSEVPWWLGTINPNKVHPLKRRQLHLYQKECYSFLSKKLKHLV